MADRSLKEKTFGRRLSAHLQMTAKPISSSNFLFSFVIKCIWLQMKEKMKIRADWFLHRWSSSIRNTSINRGWQRTRTFFPSVDGVLVSTVNDSLCFKERISLWGMHFLLKKIPIQSLASLFSFLLCQWLIRLEFFYRKCLRLTDLLIICLEERWKLICRSIKCFHLILFQTIRRC